MKAIVAALAIMLFLPVAAEEHRVEILNLCPANLTLTLWLNGQAERHALAPGKKFNRRRAHNSRTLEFTAALNGIPVDWRGKLLKARNGRFAYTDGGGRHVDIDFCDSPNGFPWFMSFSDGGDTVFPASCGTQTKAWHVRAFNIGDIGRRTFCPQNVSIGLRDTDARSAHRVYQ